MTNEKPYTNKHHVLVPSDTEAVAQTTVLAWTGMRAAVIKLALINQTSPAVMAINNEP